MKHLFYILTAVTALWVAQVSTAEDRYYGSVYGTLTDELQYQHSFAFGAGFANKQQVDAGKFSAVFVQGTGKLNSFAQNRNRFSVEFAITDRQQDNFTALVKIFENTITHLGGVAQVKPVTLIETTINGVLFSKNDYSLVFDGQPEVILTVELDRRMSKSEQIARFENAQCNKDSSGVCKIK